MKRKRGSKISFRHINHWLHVADRGYYQDGMKFLIPKSDVDNGITKILYSQGWNKIPVKEVDVNGVSGVPDGKYYMIEEEATGVMVIYSLKDKELFNHFRNVPNFYMMVSGDYGGTYVDPNDTSKIVKIGNIVGENNGEITESTFDVSKELIGTKKEATKNNSKNYLIYILIAVVVVVFMFKRK
ncbi:MAG: hypothetical protein LBG80_19035 [Bacteroidales bacterium]|jgi:hypothetical protein|nr:hypothetical protein [Bacteroidales bacterium]